MRRLVLLIKYYSGDQIEKNEMSGPVARMGERRGADRVLVRKYGEKRPLGKLSHRWEDNIKMDLQEVEWGAWTVLIWLRIRTVGRHL